MNKYFKFTMTELQETASLIAGREMLRAGVGYTRENILSELYDEIIIEIRRRRTIADEFQLKLD